MNIILRFINFALVTAFAFSQFSHAASWTAGHGDLGIGFEDGELEPHWHLGEGGEIVVIDGASGSLGPDGQEFEADEITPVTSLFTNVGGSSYYVFPNTENPTVPFIGFGTEELNSNDWVGSLTLTLTGVTGPGSFTLFGHGAIGTFDLMSSADGFDSGDSISLAPETHTHHTWAFSQQGEYSLDFQVEGNHVSAGVQSASATYSVSVVPEPSTAGLLLGVTVLVFTAIRRR